MMDQDDAEGPGVLVEERRKPPELAGAKPSCGTECQRWNRGAHSNQNDGPTSPHERKPWHRIGRHGVATHIVGPMPFRVVPFRPHIGVVVARHDSDIPRRAEPLEEGTSLKKFRWK